MIRNIFPKNISATKRKAITMIDIIFSILFVFIMLILGLKFILSSRDIDYKSNSESIATMILSNEIEIYTSNSVRNSSYEYYYDESGNRLDDGIDKSEAVYKIEINSQEIDYNLDELYLEIFDCNKGEKISEVKTKVYIPESKR